MVVTRAIRYATPLAATICLITSLSAEDYAAQVGLGDFYLGMSISDARSVHMQSPDGRRLDMACVGDKKVSAFLDEDGIARKNGVTMCAPHGLIAASYYGIKAVKFGNVSSTFILFFKDDSLYRISSEFDADDLGDIYSALSIKYGEATSRVDGSTRNGLGQEVPQTTATWSIGGDEIRLKSPARKVHLFSVDYSIVSVDSDASRAIQHDRAQAAGI